MATNAHSDRETASSDEESAEPQGFDPRDTDHPTGSKQAAENEADDPPA